MTSEKEEKFIQILDAYKKQIYRVCWGFTSDPHDVEDLFQETILNIWKGIDSFRADASHSTWIYRIAINTCILWQKKTKKQKDLKSTVTPQRIVENDAFQSEPSPQILKLRVAIQGLKKLDRSLILLVLEGFSYKEIAEILGLTVTNVGARINRIKTKIKETIQ